MVKNIEASAETGEISDEENERAIYDRLISDLEQEIEETRPKVKNEVSIGRDFYHDEDKPPHVHTHIMASKIALLEHYIAILREGKETDRGTIIRWLQHRIENGREKGIEATEDEGSLNFLQSLEEEQERQKAA